MIDMSNAALRYAVDVCVEIPEYSIIVFVNSHVGFDYAKDKIKKRLINRPVRTRSYSDVNFSVLFDNGSSITIVYGTNNARGLLCKLAIVDAGIPEPIISNVVRPAELPLLSYTFNQENINSDLSLDGLDPLPVITTRSDVSIEAIDNTRNTIITRSVPEEVSSWDF